MHALWNGLLHALVHATLSFAQGGAQPFEYPVVESMGYATGDHSAGQSNRQFKRFVDCLVTCLCVL